MRASGADVAGGTWRGQGANHGLPAGEPEKRIKSFCFFFQKEALVLF
jgi:hypothetical protein